MKAASKTGRSSISFIKTVLRKCTTAVGPCFLAIKKTYESDLSVFSKNGRRVSLVGDGWSQVE